MCDLQMPGAPSRRTSYPLTPHHESCLVSSFKCLNHPELYSPETTLQTPLQSAASALRSTFHRARARSRADSASYEPEYSGSVAPWEILHMKTPTPLILRIPIVEYPTILAIFSTKEGGCNTVVLRGRGLITDSHIHLGHPARPLRSVTVLRQSVRGNIGSSKKNFPGVY